MKNHHKIAPLFLIIMVVYAISRLANITLMNEYTDYDEGTYLLIARLINHGYLPYRDIFAVHPPLYYYILALWLRFLGDTYITGRLLSLVVGGISIVLAYLIGREAMDRRLGLVFSMTLLLDPTLLRVNRLVFQDTFVEMFSLLSLYYFVKYAKSRSLKHAYVSLGIASLGTSVKFTAIPHLVALYLVIVLVYVSPKLPEYFDSFLSVFYSRRQLFLIVSLYLLLIAFFVSLRMAWPVSLTKRVIVVLGIHPVTRVGHRYVGVFIFTLWMFLTVYVFRVRYVHKLIRLVRIMANDLKPLIAMSFAALLPKILIEGLLGYLVSRDYFHQTYLLQGSRYFSFVGLFEMAGSTVSALANDTQELVYPLVPVILLLFFVMFILAKEPLHKTSNFNDLGFRDVYILTLFEIFMYLLLFPVIPIVRFILPMFIVFYLDVWYFIFNKIHLQRTLLAYILIFMLPLSMVDYGVVFNVPAQKTEILWSPHTELLRRDAGDYLSSMEICNNTHFYSINPMNTYYLELGTPPFLVDSFGLLYVRDAPVSWFFDSLKKNNVTCIISSTWMDKMTVADGKLGEIYSNVKLVLLVNGTPIFSESFSNGEGLTIFKMGSQHVIRDFTLLSQDGRLTTLDSSGQALFSILSGSTSTSSDFRVSLGQYNGIFRVAWFSMHSTSPSVAKIKLENDSLIIWFGKGTFVVDVPRGMILDINGDYPSINSKYNSLFVYSRGHRLLFLSKKGMEVNASRIYLSGEDTLTVMVSVH